MQVENISNIDALLFVLGLVAVSILIFVMIPRADAPARPDVFDDAAITAHDAALPKYLLTAALALVAGALHLAIKSIPPVAAWLAEAGRGGHLAANIAYSHMIIVMGGTIAVTGLTWYVLPRVLRRPLYSGTLAHLAFWATVAGAGGFYLVNLSGGVIMGAMVHGGMTEAQASDTLGLWRALPTAAAAALMGLGYWIFVVNVLVTCWQGRRSAVPQPFGHLAKFFVLGTLGLLIGTVQGVLQVVPDNEDWLAAAGQAGRYIDPISHAHINLLTGVMMLAAGILFYLLGSQGDTAPDRRRANLVFWTLGPGSLALYLSFLTLGLREGDLIVTRGLSFAEAVARLGVWHGIPLAVSGMVVLAGLWTLFATILRRLVQQIAGLPGAALVCLGVVVLFIGTLQGGVQILPAVKMWMAGAQIGGQEIARTHAQFNMLGGVLPVLLGASMMIGRPFLGAPPPHALGHRMALLIGAGAGLYYVASMGAAFAMARAEHGTIEPQTAMALRSMAAPVIIGGALLYALALAILVRFIWRSTRGYRALAWHRFKAELLRHDAPQQPWRARVSLAGLLVPEGLAALFGFPGLGWILGGRALIGVPLMFGGPALAWAILPLIFSPYSQFGRPDLALPVIEAYLLSSAALSVLALWFVHSVGSGAVKSNSAP